MCVCGVGGCTCEKVINELAYSDVIFFDNLYSISFLHTFTFHVLVLHLLFWQDYCVVLQNILFHSSYFELSGAGS